MKIQLLFLGLCIFSTLNAQIRIPVDYMQDAAFTESLKKIIADVGLADTYDVGEDGTEQISFVVTDLNKETGL